jgi:nucleoside-diphosphate-sugar epimerase
VKTLVTGATGFIGKHLVKTLVKQDRDVRCLVRKTSDTRYLEDLGVELFYGDLLDKNSLHGIAKNVNIVYHLAGEIYSKRCRDFYRVNFEGTKNLVEVCLSEDIDKFIFLSSIAAVGPNQKHGILLNEQSSCNPISPYGKSKLKAEQFLVQIFKKNEFPMTIIRAPMVYGPLGQSDVITTILNKIHKDRVFIVGSGKNLRSLCYIDNLIQGLTLVGKFNSSDGEIYFISDARSYAYNEIFQTVAQKMETVLNEKHLPAWAGSICGFAFNLLSIMGFYSVTLYAAWNMVLDMACNISKAKKKLNFNPRIDIKEGIQQVIECYQKEFSKDST